MAPSLFPGHHSVSSRGLVFGLSDLNVKFEHYYLISRGHSLRSFARNGAPQDDNFWGGNH
jgi:hypothetical protein